MQANKKTVVAIIVVLLLVTLGVFIYIISDINKEKNNYPENAKPQESESVSVRPLSDEEIKKVLSKKAEEVDQGEKTIPLIEKEINEVLLKKSDPSETKPLSQDEIQSALNKKAE